MRVSVFAAAEVLCIGAHRYSKSSGGVFRWGPAQILEQVARLDAKRLAELEERVRSGYPFATLKLADCRAVEISHEAEVFLADPRRSTVPREVLAEDLRKHWITFLPEHLV